MSWEILTDIKHRPLNGLTYSTGGRGYVQLTADWANEHVPPEAKFIVFYVDKNIRALAFKLHEDLHPNAHRLNRNQSGGIQIKATPLTRKMNELGYPENSEIFLKQDGDMWICQH